MAYTNPQVADFQSYFQRDFNYSYDTISQTQVNNIDIQNALNDAAYSINPGLFQSQGQYNVGYLNLAAHFMVMSLRASSQGIAGQFSWLNTSKGVGSVSEGIQIPDWILSNPVWCVLTKTNYGLKYLYMILPNLSGQMFTVCGTTNP